MSEAREVPGRNAPGIWFGGLIKEFVTLNNSMGTWAEEHKAKAGGAPIFFSQAGIRAVTVTDAVAAQYVFAAPQDLLSRMDRTGFGPVKLQPKMIGPIRPALVAAFERHNVSRGFLNAVLTHRLPDFDKALVSSFDDLTEKWLSEESVTLLDDLRNFGAKVLARWTLDIDLDGKSAGVWLANAVTLNTSSSLANFLVSVAKRLPGSAVKTSEAINAAMRASPHFAEIARIGKEMGMSEEESLYQLSFMALFNSAAPGFSHFATLCQLDATPKWAGIVREEVGSDDLTLDGINEYPKLHQVFLEANRLYSLPRLFYRIAHKDFDLPCGDGNAYRIHSGDPVVLVMRAVYRDGQIFDEPQEFKPERYAPGNELGSYNWIFGSPTDPYRCAGALVDAKVEVSMRWWKYVLARLLQGYEWELSPRPTIDVNNQNGGAPDDLHMMRFRRRAS